MNKGNFQRKINHIFQIFSHECELHILQMVYHKNSFNRAKMLPNQTKGFRLEHRSVIKFWWLKRANHMPFTEECVM